MKVARSPDLCRLSSRVPTKPATLIRTPRAKAVATARFRMFGPQARCEADLTASQARAETAAYTPPPAPSAAPREEACSRCRRPLHSVPGRSNQCSLPMSRIRWAPRRHLPYHESTRPVAHIARRRPRSAPGGRDPPKSSCELACCYRRPGPVNHSAWSVKKADWSTVRAVPGTGSPHRTRPATPGAFQTACASVPYRFTRPTNNIGHARHQMKSDAPANLTATGLARVVASWLFGHNHRCQENLWSFGAVGQCWRYGAVSWCLSG